MAKKYKITVRSWVHKGDKLVNVDTLSPQERVELATQLKVKFLNALYEGKIIFTAEK